jgi:hypothetical protein
MHLASLAVSTGEQTLKPTWANALVVADAARTPYRVWLAWVVVAWALVVWLVIPSGIGGSWRECDTQAIARNFLADGFDPLRPRVDWRGDTDGAVECEFPLYQAMIATAMAVVGEAEWPGRVISLLAIVMATLSLHRLLEARSGPGPAFAAALVFLGGGHAFLLGARVTPDATSLALAVSGTVAFVQFLATGRSRTLVLATVMTAIACLTKPTALQVGLLQFLWTLCLAPRRLREVRVWLAFAAVLAIVGAWTVHGAALHAETGLTFGVASGGETKFPTLRSLREPIVWYWLAVTTCMVGFSVLGVVAVVLLALRRAFDRVDVALLVVVGLGLVGTLRYSHHFGVGPQYHAFAAVAGVWFVARAWPARAPRLSWALLGIGMLVVGTWHLLAEREFRLRCLASEQIATGAEVATLSAPDELTVVRGYRERTDAFWRRRTNFEEPAVLYQARRRGWVVPRDGFEPADLDALHRRGARVVVDQLPAETAPATRAWLEANAEVVREHPGRRVYRLRSQS